MMVMTATPYGNCGLSMAIAGDIQPGTHTSGNMDGFVGGGMGCTEFGDPIGTGLTGTLTLEQADGRFLRGSFELTQAFKDGSTPSPQQDGSWFPTRASSSPLSQNEGLLVVIK